MLQKVISIVRNLRMYAEYDTTKVPNVFTKDKRCNYYRQNKIGLQEHAIKYEGGGLPLHGSAGASDAEAPYRRSCTCNRRDARSGSASGRPDVERTFCNIESMPTASAPSGCAPWFPGTLPPMQIYLGVPLVRSHVLVGCSRYFSIARHRSLRPSPERPAFQEITILLYGLHSLVTSLPLSFQ